LIEIINKNDLARGCEIRGQHAEQTIGFRIDRVTLVVGDRETALRSMGTPAQALDYATPISLLNTDDCFGRVTNVLEQLRHWIYWLQYRECKPA
jgi:hypothetical protein